MFNCIKNKIFDAKIDKNEVISTPENETCHLRTVRSITEELYKRSILPFYTLIISLIASSLIIEPKSRNFLRFHKLNIFLVGCFTIILSQISLKFFLNTINITYLILILPIILVLIYYLLLLTITKFKLNFL